LKAVASTLVLTAALACLGQTPLAFRSSVELVTVPCAVVDGQGAPVRGLTREDFRVFDNGTRRVVEHLWVDADQPLTLAVLIDASESQREKLAEHRQTASNLWERLRKAGDRTFTVSIGDLGTSPLWDGIYGVAHTDLQPAAGNKALLILTDGFDVGSAHSWKQAADAAHQAGAAVYAIQYPSSLGGSYAPDLYRLVEEAGGVTFRPPRGNLDEIVSRLETDLRNRYVLGFRPEKLSGKQRHEVRVEVTRPELSVRARKTYFE
jgi:hypothetical protein